MPNRPNIRMVLSAIDLKWNVAAIAAKIAADHKDTQDEPIVLLRAERCFHVRRRPASRVACS